MTTITVINDDQTVDTFSFDAEGKSISIGRRPSNDVCIADRSVSGRHATIEHDGSAVWIHDLGSTNGTYVNGKPVERQQLRDDDEVLVGAVRLRCEVPASVAESAPAPVVDMDDSFSESMRDAQLVAADEDDELDESMRAALALYSDDPEPTAAASEPAFVDEDDDIDFSEDARLFAQSNVDEEVIAPVDNVDDDRLPEADSAAMADEPQSLTDRAKAALGREAENRPRLRAVNGNPVDDAPRTEAPAASTEPAAPQEPRRTPSQAARQAAPPAAPQATVRSDSRPLAANGDNTGPTHNLDPEPQRPRSRGAVIEIKNGAKSGQILPIDKPVTTLGRPGIQIAAIMRKPDGYFLMHIESDDSVERPTLNADSIGDEPVLLHSGDELNVAGIDVEFMLS